MQIVEPYNPNASTPQKIYFSSRITDEQTIDVNNSELWMIDLETRDRYQINFFNYTRGSYYEEIETFFDYTLLYDGSGLVEHRFFSLNLIDTATDNSYWKGIILCLNSASATPENTAKFLLRNRPPSYKTPPFPDERSVAGSDGGDYIIYE